MHRLYICADVSHRHFLRLESHQDDTDLIGRNDSILVFILVVCMWTVLSTFSRCILNNAKKTQEHKRHLYGIVNLLVGCWPAGTSLVPHKTP
jgi:TRAP-type mannitol/chloroaromatic compound transport system permease small subunit